MIEDKMSNRASSSSPFSLALFIILSFLLLSLAASSANARRIHEDVVSDSAAGYVVRRDQRRSLVKTEYGEITSVDVTDGRRGPYHVQFITMEPNSLFLPVLLHSDMVFYVHTGSGRLNWAHGKDDQINRVPIKRGDVHRIHPGSVFFVQSDLETERQKLRIHVIFSHTDEGVYDPTIGAYSSVRDLVRGFDTKVLHAAFKVSDEVIESITNSTDRSAIVHAVPTKKETFWDMEAQFLKTFVRASYDDMAVNKKHMKKDKKPKSKEYNIFDEEPDFKNCNGWSLTVNERNSPLLKGSNIGLFMVNLTKGSMMGPHWNPIATEIAVVLQGQGMVRAVCSSTAKKSECRNTRFRVQEGDIFAVPMFHPMAQMSYNNGSLVFMGFTTTRRKNYPQFLAGKYSVLQTLNRQVLAVALNVTNTTIDQLLAAQAESIILDCTSCAEEEERVMLEEMEEEREEAEAKEIEEQRKREEEERKREEEQRQMEEEEEERKRREEEEERRKREEEQRQREEEEEEEIKRREEEEEERRKREEQERQQQEERERERQQEAAAAAARREQKEQAKRQQEEAEREDEARRQQEEAEREDKAKRQQEEAEREDEARRQQEEAEREDEAKRQQEEAEREDEARRQQEEAEREDEAKRQQEEAEREDEARRQQEEERRAQEEQEEARRQEAEREWRQQEDEYSRRRGEEAQSEQEEARKQQEEMEGRTREEGEAGTQPEEATTVIERKRED